MVSFNAFDRQILKAFQIFMAVVFLLTFVKTWHQLSIREWGYSDWLINYGAGYVRRGLSGEVVLSLAPVVKPELTMLFIAMACYFVIFLSIYWMARRIVTRVEIILCLISPLGLLFHAYNNSVGSGRKELMFLALFAAQLGLAQNRGSAQGWQVLIILMWGILFLFWEGGYFFVGFPLVIFFISTAKSVDDRSAIGTAAVMFGVLSIIFGINAVLSMTASPQQIAAMCDALGSAAPDTCTQFSAISYLQTPLSEAVKQVVGMAGKGALWVYFIVACLGALPIMLVWSLYEFTADAKVPPRYLAAGLVLANLFVIPLYAVAFDWGRWLNITYLFTIMSVLFFINTGRLRRVVSDAQLWSEMADRPALLRLASPILVIAMLVYSLGWSVPVCCAASLEQGAFGTVERMINRETKP